MIDLSMVIHDFDVLGSAACPPKADSPLVVDPDAVLALAVAPQGFQSIARRDPQVIEATGDLELAKFATCGDRTAFEPLDPVPARQGRSFRASV
jgi:hypothetical protein